MLFFSLRTAPDNLGLVLSQAEAARRRAAQARRALRAAAQAERLFSRLRRDRARSAPAARPE